MEKNKSSVFRTNVPPSFPFFLDVNPNVIAVLDVKSFSHLFDLEIVEKKDVLVGSFVPSTRFTGDVRVGVYLDTAEPKHSEVKNLTMELLQRGSKVWQSELLSNLDKMWDMVEATVAEKGKATYLGPLQQCIFNFIMKALAGIDPAVSPQIANSGYIMLDRWLFLQLLPTVNIGILQPLEEIFLHSWAYPFFLVRNDYKNLYDFIKQNGKEVLQIAETKFGLTEEETIHNLLFVIGFNAFGGFSVFLPSLLDAISSDQTGLQDKLKKEVREHSVPGSGLDFETMSKMELVKSVVYEALRFKPPVPTQYGRARKDFRLTSHDSVYDIKKGELLCGFQPLVMRDPEVFDEPEKFKPDRFLGEGSKLLSYLYWSNGPQTGSPSESNKQCAAKEVVPLTACLVVAHLFLRYEKISGGSGSITALEKTK